MARSKHKRELLQALYRGMLRPRMLEEKMLLLLRQGKVTKWFSGIGQEAISVGVTTALEDDEYILPLHRNLGVFTTRGIPLDRLLLQFQGKEHGFTKGRDRSFHFGTNDYKIVGMISHLGPQLAVADGIALADVLKGQRRVTAAFTGEGGTSEGDFHEALNVAAVWSLPVIFVIENNGYGLSTPTQEQFRCAQLSERAAGYGMKGVTIDGNDVLEVYDTISKLAAQMRKRPAPVLVECMTFRMRGHEEASGTKYVPAKLFKQWAKRDPVQIFESRLLRDKILTKAQRESMRAEIAAEIDAAVEAAFGAPEVEASIERELADVYAPAIVPPLSSPSPKRTKRRFVDSISDGLRQAMEAHPKLVLMGQDIAQYGGVFKVTEGFLERFGAHRVRNTPLCESAIVGAALGLSVGGIKSVVEMQFADFVSCAFTQIVNNLAKTHYRWGQAADTVIRMPTGAGSRAGPFHSQSNEAWFFHTPGLKVVYPATPTDAKGLLLAAIHDPNPVIYFEHKGLYRSVEEEVPDDPFLVEIGKARIARQGEDVTVIAYGAAVHWAQAALSAAPEVSVELIDLRSLLPFDWNAIAASVRKTGRALIVHEATLTGGIGAEIAARIAAELFEHLDAPVMRVASLDSPVPFAAPLEDQFLPRSRIEHALRTLAGY
ncbi:MAG: dehydrogenase E1 component subunit alpha/beta [Bdellovibrionota bacterium]